MTLNLRRGSLTQKSVAAECIEAIEHKDDVDWPVVVQACELLSRCFFDVSEYVGYVPSTRSLNTQTRFLELRDSGWATELKLDDVIDRLRNLRLQQDDQSLAQRNRGGCLQGLPGSGISKRLINGSAHGNLLRRWARLSVHRVALGWQIGYRPPASRYALVANEIRIATDWRCCTTTCGYRYRNGSERTTTPSRLEDNTR